jgi:hypothetical protein
MDAGDQKPARHHGVARLEGPSWARRFRLAAF